MIVSVRAAAYGRRRGKPENGDRPANKGRRFPAELLSAEEIRALIRACSAKAPTGIRNRALIAVLYRGGLRISEALALYPKDVDQAAGTVVVLHGKGDRRRTVGMVPAAFALLERWLDKRVHAHGLRHAHAAELVAEGVPVNVIQQQLGHGSLATTDRYLRHIAPRERVEAMRARAWKL